MSRYASDEVLKKYGEACDNWPLPKNHDYGDASQEVPLTKYRRNMVTQVALRPLAKNQLNERNSPRMPTYSTAYHQRMGCRSLNSLEIPEFFSSLARKNQHHLHHTRMFMKSVQSPETFLIQISSSQYTLGKQYQ